MKDENIKECIEMPIKQNLSKVREESAARLNRRAAELNIKQVDVVRYLSSSKSTVNGWFAGKAQPRGNDLLKLCRMLKCSVDWYVTGSGSVAPTTELLAFAVFPGTWEADLDSGAQFYRVPALMPDGTLDRDGAMPIHRSSFVEFKSIALAAWFWSTGGSARPLVSEGDMVLVDTSEDKSMVSGGVYAFKYAGGFNIHKTFANVDGSLVLEDSTRPGGSLTVKASDVKVIGRVLHRSGSL